MSFFFPAESPVKNIPGNVPARSIGNKMNLSATLVVY